MGILTSSSSSAWIRKQGDLIAAEVKEIDSFNFNNFLSSRYVVSLQKPTENQARMFDLSISRKNNDVKHQIFARVGDNIEYDFSVTLSSGRVVLTLTNTGTTALRFILYRLDF